MNIKSIFLAATLIFATAFCGLAADITPSSRYVTRKVEVRNFTGLRTNSSIDIEYTVGPFSVEVYAPDNLIDYISVSVKGHELNVRYSEDMSIKGNHNSCVRVSAPDVTSFTASSAGSISINSNIAKKNAVLSLTCNSAGGITAKNLEGAAVNLLTNSAGSIQANDIKAENVDITTNSAGGISAKEVTAKKTVEIKSNSAGKITIDDVVAGDAIKANTNSAGSIYLIEANAPLATATSRSTGDVSIESLKANNVEASVTSVGKVTLSGNCDKADLSALSTGGIYAKNLKANHVKATVRSQGDIICTALQSLNAKLSGFGKIRYAGNPSDITIDDPRGGVSKL